MTRVETRYEVEVPTGQPVVQWEIRDRKIVCGKRFQPGEDGLSGVLSTEPEERSKVRLCRVQTTRYGVIQGLTCGHFDPSGDMVCG